MSQTDLEFCQALPKIRAPQLSPMIKLIHTPEPSEAKITDPSPGPPPAIRIRAIIRRRGGGEDEDKDKDKDKDKDEDGDEDEDRDGDEDGECRTPTAKEHRIPEMLTCPPAPRKPASRAPACKRKLASELEFFDVANRGEVEEFFRSSFVAKPANKRNCCPCK